MKGSALRIEPGERVFVLTGAGVSAESGVPTFRDAGGLWERYRIEDVASPEGWRASPETVWRFYSERRERAAQVKPNPAHVALGELEKAMGERLFLCTQNVDALHEQGGSRHAVHMHGELFKSRCETPRCGEPYEDHGVYRTAAEIPRCPRCSARIRPHICWFGEMPFELDRIGRELQRCDWLVVIGSSGAVYPAAGFVHQVHARRGKPVRSVYVGPEPPENADAFDEHRVGKAGEIVPSLFLLA